MILEIGPGRGDFLFWIAGEHPEEAVCGIEYKKKRFDKLVRRLLKNGLTNVLLRCGDARAVIPNELTSSTVREVYILFNDPWPKRRHTRHRVFQQGLIEELYRVLEPGGRVFIATDDARYKEAIQAVFLHYPSLVFTGNGLHFPTFYAQKWTAEGRTIFSFSYTKQTDAQPTIEST